MGIAHTLRRLSGQMSRGGEEALLQGSSSDVSPLRVPTARTSSARRRLHFMRLSFCSLRKDPRANARSSTWPWRCRYVSMERVVRGVTCPFTTCRWRRTSPVKGAKGSRAGDWQLPRRKYVRVRMEGELPICWSSAAGALDGTLRPAYSCPLFQRTSPSMKTGGTRALFGQ